MRITCARTSQTERLCAYRPLYIEDFFNFMSDFAGGAADFDGDGRTTDADVRAFGDCFLHQCR